MLHLSNILPGGVYTLFCLLAAERLEAAHPSFLSPPSVCAAEIQTHVYYHFDNLNNDTFRLLTFTNLNPFSPGRGHTHLAVLLFSELVAQEEFLL